MTRQTARWTLPYLDIETPLARRGFCSNPILSVTLVGYQAQDLRSQPWNIFTIWDCEICQRQIIVIYWFRYKLRFLLWKENQGVDSRNLQSPILSKGSCCLYQGSHPSSNNIFHVLFQLQMLQKTSCLKMKKNVSLWKSAPLRAALKTHGFN